jgi:hypothetical protein
MTQRIQRHPFLAVFDGADPSTSTAARLTSTTPVQALFLLNDPLVHAQSERFGRRILRSGGTHAERIGRAYLWALSRWPDAQEVSMAEGFLKEAMTRDGGADPEHPAAWNSLARSLMRLNEFVYLD